MDKFSSIRAFTKVVQHGNFSKAAKELHLSRSAISKYVIDLEQHLGVQLMSRTTRSARPTESGQAYYERCQSILTDLANADHLVGQLQKAPRGTLRVNAPVSFSILPLGEIVADFMAAYPDLRIELITNDRLIDPVQEGIDVMLHITEPLPSSLIARKIVDTPCIFCAAPTYLQRRGIPNHPGDLRQHDCLNYGNPATNNQWKLTGPTGDEHWIQVPWTLCSDNAEVLRDATVKERGIALLPAFVTGADLRSGVLHPILSRYKAPDIALYALYSPTRHLPIKIRVFIDFLIGRFGRRLPATPTKHAEIGS
ncbi:MULTISPECIES: LysR family transcriptional regulator [unclassified Beijerinckia]|uniref:LysR family transcriptional regulator n=1 Tax=unclassified Beijerinckia TaxID=2638183 RepID=UPI000898C008|nr:MULTISPECIES: LysR family transcriptional regulator [unclassified Beijerinckia]MDH7799063.1 DNA-binding transcriptional LysR family regulator [Beijerinckia sp. GAS462]SED96282.1 transcriptional regulator, LysR family [Beijerinckia sp. 28-YEA-48]